MTEVKAKLSRLTISPYKVRLLADQIRGKRVEEAIEFLLKDTEPEAIKEQTH